jgi:hypothetical protein
VFVERHVPPELQYRNRSPKRSPRVPRRDLAKRSLVNCNHLASSDTKLLREETMQEYLERTDGTDHYWRAKKANSKKLQESLKITAVRYCSEDRERWKKGLKPIERGEWSPVRDLKRVEGCQSEWIGFEPSCCNGRAVAVPIGCNHRLCALCNAARMERYRGPAKELLKVMENPAFLTLTIPNVTDLTARTFKQLRTFWKAFERKNRSFLRGGIYAVETTFNKERIDWHPHIHAVIDTPWPMRGMKHEVFTKWKMLLEFDWLLISSPEARKEFGRNGFDRWRAEANQQVKQSEWNKKFRRVIDIRAVKNDSSAVYELVKYISKTNSFIDCPDAVEAYLRAVRNVRVIQTFGCYYNFKIEVPMTKADLEALADSGIDTGNIPVGAASFLRCECGKNEFHRIGVFNMADVERVEDGRYLVRLSHERRRCRGSSTGTGGD